MNGGIATAFSVSADRYSASTIYPTVALPCDGLGHHVSITHTRALIHGLERH